MKNYKTHFLYILVILYSTLLNAHCPPYAEDECAPYELGIDAPLTVLEKIQEKKTLDVVILNSPTTYYAGTEKELGFEYELISEFAKAINVDLNLTVVFTVSEALQKSREGVGDITVYGLTITPKRQDEFKFGPQ